MLAKWLIGCWFSWTLLGGCARQSDRLPSDDAWWNLFSWRRSAGISDYARRLAAAHEPGPAFERRLAAPPPINRTPLPTISSWLNDALAEALQERSWYRVKGPAEVITSISGKPAGMAFERFGAEPAKPMTVREAGMAIGKAINCDFVLLETLDELSRIGLDNRNYPLVRVAYRAFLVEAKSGRVVWSQAFATELTPHTSLAEPAIRWVLLETQRAMISNIPWANER
ncbi:MAG: hypothetical protein HY692_07950 [Cyanobacteria bacterium NC_groundwater_1444_Ag_S-0.65um_54_12]|nr:hypothetical protein [Cyanobacteria bacterium NC_groundwater_1444_Ag_S-0.65um_54_12]